MKEQVAAFLDAFVLCTISTVTGDGKPEAAYVGYTHSKDLELIIGTSKLSRKYANLQQNPLVAIVVASLEGEVQYEGEVQLLSPQQYEEAIQAGTFKQLSGIEKYRDDPNQAFLRVTPTWVRFIKHGEVDLIEEMTEF